MSASPPPMSCPADPSAVDRAALTQAIAAARTLGVREGHMSSNVPSAKLQAVDERLPSGTRRLGDALLEPGPAVGYIRAINEIRVDGRLRAYVYRVGDGTMYVQTDTGTAGARSTLAILRDPDTQLPPHGEASAVTDAHGTPIPGVARFMPRYPTAALDCRSNRSR